MKLNIDGRTIDTEKATASYEEDTRWDGHNHISIATGSQWEHETLYCSAKGNWYLVHTSQWEGSPNSGEWITDERAAQWLIENDHELPESLAPLAEKVCE